MRLTFAAIRRRAPLAVRSILIVRHTLYDFDLLIMKHADFALPLSSSYLHHNLFCLLIRVQLNHFCHPAAPVADGLSTDGLPDKSRAKLFNCCSCSHDIFPTFHLRRTRRFRGAKGRAQLPLKFGN